GPVVPDDVRTAMVRTGSDSADRRGQSAPHCVASALTVRPEFLRKEADLAGAASWHKGKLKIKNNTSKFNLDGRNADMGFAGSRQIASPANVRQTIRIGDVCITSLLSCTANASGKRLKCAAAAP